MSEMLERLEKAIQDAGIGELIQGEALALARIAVEAMREPTEEMVKAAEDGDTPGSSIFGDPFEPLAHDEAWRAMIDAALGKVDA